MAMISRSFGNEMKKVAIELYIILAGVNQGGATPDESSL
jgi:hypothetical protein